MDRTRTGDRPSAVKASATVRSTSRLMIADPRPGWQVYPQSTPLSYAIIDVPEESNAPEAPEVGNEASEPIK